jgi:hypothetical protein
MGASRWLSIGATVVRLLPIGAGYLAGQVLSPIPPAVGDGTLAALALALLATFVASIVLHELGHVLAIRLAGKQPTAVRLLGPSHRALTFHLGTLPVRAGFKGGGRVEYPGDGLTEPGIRELLSAPGWSSRPDAASRLISGWVLEVPGAEQCLMVMEAASVLSRPVAA